MDSVSRVCTRLFGRSLPVLALFISGQVLTSQSIPGQDAAIPFVEGLRSRGYYDTAIEHLDQLAKDSDLPVPIREILEFERGLTLQQMGSSARVPEDRDQILNQAEESLRRFVTQYPQHLQAALANSSLGELLFERARTLIWQADGPSNADRRATMQQQARKLIDDAEAIYQKAHDLYEAQYKKFPTSIDQAREPDLFQQRLDAEARYLRAWFNLNRCAYERGQTYDRGSAERKQLLIRAAELFDAIHTSRRTNVIGLNARLMMGKCFQEQDDIGRALGIYNEMLAHKSDHPSVQNLKSIALHYRLICLNDPTKHDHQIVLQEATEWLTANRALQGTSSGIGILWEKAVAVEKLAEDRNLDAKTKEVLQRQAMADARQVARYPGAFREPANAMQRRIKSALGDRDKEPRDFETAFERARGMIDQIQKLKDETELATPGEGRQSKELALDLHLNEVGRLLQLALDLRTDDTDAKAVAQARYLLSFIFFRQRKNFDAVIMSSYCMVRDRSADPDTALNATEIAVTAAVQAWNDAAVNDRDFETELLRDVCLQVLQLYPQSARGNEARMRLGRVYLQLQNPLEAARWFLQVPESDPQFASARIHAGQAFWAAWTTQTAADEDKGPAERSSSDDMENMKREARTLLEQGVQLFRDRSGTDAALSEEVIAAEVSLASILNLDGDFQQSIVRLTSGNEHSVVSSIEVEDPETRPESGVMSRAFAGLTLRLLLRAYVGTQQIDDAIQTMSRLEKLGGQDITAVYTQLGMELQEELQRLKQANESQRLTEVRQSFEKFLQKVFEQRDPSDYNSLLWIGETYYGLGQGVADDVAAATGYYENAATSYRTILDGNLAQEPTITAIRLRLARCRRQQQQFEESFRIAHEILRANPLALDAQFEAALTLADWGASGQPEKLLDAIQGIKNEGGELVVWGWANIAKRLQQTVQRDNSDELKQRFLDARYQLSASRRRYAATGAPDSETQLKSGLAEITVFTQVYRDIDDVWWARFNRLFQDLQTDLGQAAKPLERPVAVVPAQPASIPGESLTASSGNGQELAGSESTPTPTSGGNLLMTVLAVCLAAAVGGAFYFLLSKPPQRRRPLYALSPPGAGRSSEGLDFPAMTASAAESPRVAAAAASTSGSKPVRRPPTESAVSTAEERKRKLTAQPTSGASGTGVAGKSAGTTPAVARPRRPESTAPDNPEIRPAAAKPRPATDRSPTEQSSSGQTPAKKDVRPRPPAQRPSTGSQTLQPGEVQRPQDPSDVPARPRKPRPPEQDLSTGESN